MCLDLFLFTGKQDCVGGTDLSVCENHMQYQCVTQGGMTLNRGMLMDACGGHATYHLHLDPACDYDRSVCQCINPSP